MTLLLNIADADRLHTFHNLFAQEMPDLRLVTPGMCFDPAQVRYLFTWMPLDDWTRFPNLEVVFSLSAGVDQFATLPPGIQLVKMVDPHNTQGVVEYVLTACLACIRDFPTFAWDQAHCDWQPTQARPIRKTHVGILGLGGIGQDAARALATLGFQVSGWSRSQKQIPGVTCLAGEEGYKALVAQADVVVCLLPLTPQTSGFLNRAFFGQMKAGASLVHAGRGAQCCLPDLRAALESGHLRNAVIDVFETEPLAQDDANWRMPRCLITPHVAGRTDGLTAAQNVLHNISRHRSGQDLLWTVDRDKGY